VSQVVVGTADSCAARYRAAARWIKRRSVAEQRQHARCATKWRRMSDVARAVPRAVPTSKGRGRILQIAAQVMAAQASKEVSAMMARYGKQRQADILLYLPR